MKNKITLSNPLSIAVEQGTKTYTELTYDTETITVEQFQDAERRAAFAAAKKTMVVVDFLESNGTFQQLIGMYAIINVNPEIDFSDLEKIKGFDLLQIYRVGRNFIKGSAQENDQEEESQAESSDEQSEPTQEPTTATLESLEELD